MRLSGFLSRAQVETVHRNALRVLAEVGVDVPHEGLRAHLAAIGGEPDRASGRVRFPASSVERLIADAPRAPFPETGAPRVIPTSGVYQCQYLDPDDGRLRPFDDGLLARYCALARSLPGMGSLTLLGLPFAGAGVPPALAPLLEKVHAWRHGVDAAGSVQLTALCGPLLDLFECHAGWAGRPVEDVFVARGYLVSPLRLGRPECEQWLYFADKGRPMSMGHQPSQGGTAPITLAGALTLALAEQLFLFLLERCRAAHARLELVATVMTVDPRSGAALYGRPEQQRVNLAFADLARFYGCPCRGHTGLSDAKVPSGEAGAQKAAGALLTALALGEGTVEAGLLSVDEVCSPVQMVLDHEVALALDALLRAPVVDDAECALDDIARLGPGGSFFDAALTAERCRTELFLPSTWSRELLGAWQRSGSRRDADRARERVAAFAHAYRPASLLSEGEERELAAIVARAARLVDGA